MTQDTLARLQALNPEGLDTEPPAFNETLARIEARAGRGSTAAVPHVPRRVRRTLPAGLLATGVIAATLVVAFNAPEDGGVVPRLGVLEAAAASAAQPGAGPFDGYVYEERTTLNAVGDQPAMTLRNREVVRRVSDTEFDGSLESVQPYQGTARPPQRNEQGVRRRLDTDGRISSTRDGDETTMRITWRRRYGTIFTGAVRRGERPVLAPTDPQIARRAVASWATGRAPEDGNPAQARDLRDAYGPDDGTQLALGYATEVLTAPRVEPAVRSAVFEALAGVPGLHITGDATDPAGRPAAALSSDAEHGRSRSHFVLFVDPATARVLGSSDSYGPADPSLTQETEPPLGSGTRTATYNYDH